jgi:hypothetical protein
MATDEIHKALMEHERKDEALFTKVSETLALIKENHLAHMEADLAWLKWGLMLVIAGVVANYFKG